MSASTELLLDRFVSASTAADASDSIQALIDSEEALTAAFLEGDNENGLQALLHTLEGRLNEFAFEEGPALACRMYLKLYKLNSRQASNVLLQKPEPGRLVQILLDVVTPADTSISSYTRVLALQVLKQICTASPSTAQTQLLETPNGLHRLAELLREEDEQVRNATLLVGISIAEWPSCANVWVFNDVCDILLQLALQEGGLTEGHVVVQDCLEICRNLLKHDPASSTDLVLSSSTVPQNLTALLDLRGGTEFRNPPTQKVQPKDDLDDILKGGESATTKEQFTPRLTSKEEGVLQSVLQILHLLLSTPAHQQSIWKQHPALSSLVWELALVSPPPPTVKPPCAMPSAALQQEALQLVAQRFSNQQIMERHNGMDRLLYLVCTGGGATAQSWQEKLGLSQSALHCLRNTLSSEKALLLVGHTLAPPAMETSEPLAVQKLVNTVAENLEGPPEEGKAMLERRRINLLGSLGALGVFVMDTTTRDMMLPIFNKVGLVDAIFASLDQQDSLITLALLRFLSVWLQDTSAVVQALLSSTYSTSLGVLFQKSDSTEVSTLAGLLLGLLMDGMEDDDGYGGWTRQGILTMISNRKGGISGYTASLESLKTDPSPLPWTACKHELQVFSTWYKGSVHTVRRRVVQELTQAGGQADDDDDEEEETDMVGSNSSVKSLRRLMSQQSAEVLELQESLAAAQATIDSQKQQLDTWKRRVESNPTQLDDMLNEFTSKNEELDKMVASLQKELSQTKQQLESRLNDKDKELSLVRQELTDCQDRERDAREERDALVGEMEALSGAYSTLEAEYNRRIGASTATAAPTSEGADGHQPQGEVSHQQTSSSRDEATEVMASLREENARLRSEAIAADEWMSMAVQRMNDVGGQNVSLQQEVATLKEQLSGTGTAVVQGDDARIQQLQEELANAQKDTAAAMDSLGKTKTERDELEKRVDVLQSEFESVRIENLSLRENLRIETSSNQSLHSDANASEALSQLRAEHDALVDSKDQEITMLQNEIEALQQSLMSETNSDEVNSLRESIERLENEVASTRKQLSDTLKREGEEIRRRDATILDLEGRLAHSNVQSHADRDLKSRDEEIAQLKSANEAAQEWMAKAVEHHQMLSEQLSALEQDKAALNKEIKELQGVLSSTERRLESVQHEKELKESELLKQASAADDSARVADELTRLRQELHAAQAESSRLREEQANYEQSVQDRSMLERAKDTAVAKVDELQEAVAQQAREIEGLKLELQSAQRELEENKTELASRNASDASAKESTENEIRTLKVEIDERDRRIETMRAELAESQMTQADVIALRNQLEAAEADFEGISSELEAARSESSVLRERNAELQQANDQLIEVKAKLEEAGDADKGALSQLQDDVASLRTENVLLQEQCSEYDNTVKELQSNLDEFKSWADIAQKKIVELQAENENTEELTAIRSELDSKTLQLDAAVSERDELIVEQKKLNAMVEKLETESGNWQGKCKSIEQDMKVLEAHVEELKHNAKESDDLLMQLSDKDDALAEAEGALDIARKELEEVQEQSEDVVRQWKDRAGELEVTVNELESELEKQEQEATDAVSQWEERCSILEKDMIERAEEHEALINELEGELEKQQQEATDAVSQWETRCALLEENAGRPEKLSELETELRKKEEALAEAEEGLNVLRKELEDVHGQSEEVVRQWKERASELESQVGDLEQELEQQQADASDAVSQWESRCSELQENCSQLQSDVEAASIDRDLLSKALDVANKTVEKERSLLSSLRTDLQAKTDHVASLQADVDSKQSLLASSAEQVSEERNTWFADRKSLEAQLEELTALLTSAEDEIEIMNSELLEFREQSEDVVNQWKERTEELESTVIELEEQLEQQQAEATGAISQWEMRCSALEERSMQLENDLEESAAAAISSLRAELEAKDSRAASFAIEVDNERNSWNREREEYAKEKDSAASIISSLKSELDESTTRWKEKEKSLLNELEQARQEREKLQQEMAEVKEQASGQSEIMTVSVRRFEELESELETEKVAKEKVEGLLATQVERMAKLKKHVAHLKAESAKGSSDLHDELQAALMAKAEAEEALEAGRLRENENESRWSRERDCYEQEKVSLVTLVGELQEELKEANDTLQSCFTDEVSDRAAEIATRALREQIDVMRSRLSDDRSALEGEKRARVAAETEVERLRSDLAVLLEMDTGNEESASASQRLAHKAADKIHRKERKEIEDLRKALERALQELASSKEKEKDAEEKAAASRMHASVCEQEIIAAKSDLSFLTQTMDEMRDAESTVRASLEHRISALEEDRELLKRVHADELENLSNELTHLSIERDRVLHLLKESEKKNDSYINSTKKQDDEEDMNPASELIKLRVEKAQLLEAAIEEGAKTERRIREAVAAHSSMIEADVIVERELRVAAEATLEDLKQQMDEHGSVGSEGINEEQSIQMRAAIDKLKNDLASTKEETEKLKEENAALQTKLEDAAADAKATVAEITERWRKAQAKAHQLEREGHFDSEVNVEIARLRAESARSAQPNKYDSWVVVTDNPAEGGQHPVEEGIVATDAFDYIQKQKAAIKEERVMYSELLAEHDDLLALLAQLDLEKSSLLSTLERVAGQEEVDHAIREAEKNAVKQFGKFVRLE